MLAFAAEFGPAQVGSMIEKLEFYHGAALVRLIEDPRCGSVSKYECGYRVNDRCLVAIKYSTKARSPWGFSFSQDDIDRLQIMAKQFGDCLVALVCGGDGICALSWKELETLLASAPGGISAKRSFSGCYSVSGPAGTLRRKIPMNRWPNIVFDGEDKE